MGITIGPSHCRGKRSEDGTEKRYKQRVIWLGPPHFLGVSCLLNIALPYLLASTTITNVNLFLQQYMDTSRTAILPSSHNCHAYDDEVVSLTIRLPLTHREIHDIVIR